MNSIHELIAVFLQRGTCIESICLRKENQRYFCQDADFRSSPTDKANDEKDDPKKGDSAIQGASSGEVTRVWVGTGAKVAPQQAK